MVTIRTYIDADRKKMHEVRCLHDDSKPVFGITNGSLCLEIDTGDIYCLDGVSGTWNKLGDDSPSGSSAEQGIVEEEQN